VRVTHKVLALIALVMLVSCAREQAGGAAAIAPAELAARISSGTAPVILDVRTPEEFAAGHIPGARNVPVQELGEQLASLNLAPSQEIVVHCEKGGRAATAESLLRERGYENVRDLTGHMQSWRAEKLPLE
jgi:rhodanese-related sulfurtransferase